MNTSGEDIPVVKGIEIQSIHKVGNRSEWFVGMQTMLGRPVAVKRLKADLAASFNVRESFINAARQAASIIHPNALSIINIFPDQDVIISEWREADSMRDLGGKLSGLHVAKVGISVLDGLASLHATDRAHGNLTPGNVFLDIDNKVRINDFFLLPVIECGNQTFIADEHFTAPEVLNGQQPDWRSDIYSLGKLLRFLIGPAERPGEMTKAIEQMCDPTPDNRADSPWDAYQNLTKARRFEERRRGFSSTSLVRRRRQYRRIPAELSVTVKNAQPPRPKQRLFFCKSAISARTAFLWLRRRLWLSAPSSNSTSPWTTRTAARFMLSAWCAGFRNRLCSQAWACSSSK